MTRGKKTDPDRQFETALEIDAPRDAVWAALTEDRELRRWFAPDARVVPGPGGEIVWSWGAIQWPNTIETWEPGKHLRARYDSSVVDDAGRSCPLFLDFTLEGDRGTTTLRLVHSGFGPQASFDEELDGISRGWPVELQSLRLYLERHQNHDRQLAWTTALVGGDLGAAWAKLGGAEGLRLPAAAASWAPGDAFRFTSVDGTTFHGTVLRNEEHELIGVAASHGDGFLRLCVENCGGNPQAWLWLGRWDGVDVSPTQESFDAILKSLFGSVEICGIATPDAETRRS